MKDCIRLLGMTFYGFHGVIPEERATGRVYEVDCELVAGLSKSAQTDAVTDTIDYSRVFTAIREIVEKKQFKLLETLADHIIVRLMNDFQPDQVTLKLRKLQPPIAGNIRAVEIEMSRSSSGVTS